MLMELLVSETDWLPSTEATVGRLTGINPNILNGLLVDPLALVRHWAHDGKTDVLIPHELIEHKDNRFSVTTLGRIPVNYIHDGE